MSRWRSRPVLARLLRVLIVLLPVVMAVGFTWLAGRVLPPQRVGLPRWAWIVAAFVAANVVLAGLRRLTRRLTPLVALMKLTLVFPDHAPSRVRSALRGSNSRAMLRQIEEAKARGESGGEVLHSEYLVQMLKEINDHDRLTRGHSERVRAYSELLGNELGLPENEMHKLRWSALLHDVGKLEVPYEILNKDGLPTEDEWRVLSGHPAAGGRRLEPLRPWLGDWVHSADQHHCRWDGGGYPHDLAGTDISLPGRLVAVADAYDVMTSARSYKPALDHDVARQELTNCAGSQFDPEMVRAFLNISLGRLRTVAGPLAWLANLMGSAQVPVPVATTATAAGSGVISATAGLAAAAFAGLVPGSAPAAPPLERVVAPQIAAEDVEVVGFEDQPVEVVLVAQGGQGPVAFRVGAAANGEVVLGASVLSTGQETGQRTGAAVEVDGRWEAVATYVPRPDFNGEDGFGYEACDARDDCAPATARILIEAVNDAPTAVDDEWSTQAGEAIQIDVLANDVDIDGDPLVLHRVNDPDRGFALVANGRITYVPDDDFVGTEVITYVVRDSSGELSTATVTVEVTSAPPPPTTTTTTTVPPVNHDPVAVDDTASVDEDESVHVAVLGNDTDPENDPLTIAAVSDPLHGTAAIDGTQILYLPDDDYNGTDTFTYAINDGHNPDIVAAVMVTVDPVNDPPVAADDGGVGFTTVEDVVGFATPDVTANDTDVDDSVDPGSVSVVATTANGTLVNNGDGTFDYTPDPGWVGTATFTYTIRDPDSATSNTATVSITVAAGPVNQVPVANDDGGVGFTTTEDVVGFTTADVTANDTDPDDPVDPASVSVVATTANGSLVNNGDGTFDYTPDPDWSGIDTFTYTVTDPEPATSDTATVSITVAAQNDPPVANDDGGVGFTTTEDVVGFTTADVTANDTDPDDPVDPGSVSIGLGPANGSLLNNGDRTFDYTPDPDWSGIDTFTYTVTDPEPATSDTATVSITVNGVNDAPAVTDPGAQTGAEQTPFSLQIDATDGEGHNLSYSATGLPAGLSIDVDGLISGTPDPGTNGSYSVDVTVTDDGIPSEATTITFSLDVNYHLVSPYAGDIVINEVLYRTIDPVAPEEFVELHNQTAAAIDLTGWNLADGNLKVDGTANFNYVIPATDHWGAPSVLQPGRYAVVWLIYDGANLPPLVNPPDGLEYVIAGSSYKLDNTADDVWLLDPDTMIVDYVAYGSGGFELGTPPEASLNLWDDTFQAALSTLNPESLAVTPNGANRDDSACWEPTASDDANGRCAGALPTYDNNSMGVLATSVGQNNNWDGTSVPLSAAGHEHTCGVAVDRTIWCSGYNNKGQLGDGSQSDSSTRVRVLGPGGVGNLSAVGVAATHDSSCAIEVDATVWCWGHNNEGQLGDGSTTDSTVPVAVSGLTSVTAVAGGEHHACAVRADSTVWCWGLNDKGQLGDGSTTDSTVPVQIVGPGGVGLLTGALDVVAGKKHTCVTMSDGTALCWGDNGGGQLGDGTTSDSAAPVTVSGLSNSVALGAGLAHTCATTSDGEVRCWGKNDKGQLGDGTTTDSSVPVTVRNETDTGPLTGAVGVGAGEKHSCARRADGTAICWGNDNKGDLGDGAPSGGSSPLPVQVVGPGGVGNLTGVASVSVGSGENRFACGGLASGEIHCWGHNNKGQLGDGTTTDRPHPVQFY